MKKMELTKYEKARLVGARALQLAAGAPYLVKLAKPEVSAVKVALLELEKGVLPLHVVREGVSA